MTNTLLGSSGSENLVVVQFEKRFVSGRALRRTTTSGGCRFSGSARAKWLKPFGICENSAASLKRSPDTNRLSNCTTTEKLVRRIVTLKTARIVNEINPSIVTQRRFRQPPT